MPAAMEVRDEGKNQGDNRRGNLVERGDLFSLPAMESVIKANVGKKTNANKEKPPTLATYDPFANVGKVSRKVLPMPTLANRSQVLNLQDLKWTRPAGKPPQPKGFYWQASGSKTEKGRTFYGWTLVRNGKCQGCGKRYRPPVVYLKGETWATLKGETIERQKTEIKLLLGNSRGRLNDLRCPECLPGNHGQMPIIGRA